MKWSDNIWAQDTVYRDSKYSHDIDADLRDRSFWDKAVLDTKMLSYDAAMRTYSGLVEIDIKYMRTFILEEQGKTKSIILKSATTGRRLMFNPKWAHLDPYAGDGYYEPIRYEAILDNQLISACIEWKIIK